MITKSQVEKEIEGNKWFDETVELLQDKTLLPIVYMKIIVAEAIMEYLINAISFHMFIEVIDRVGERKEIKPDSEMDTIITKLLSLSKYGPDPDIHKPSIIDTINDVVQDLEKIKHNN